MTCESNCQAGPWAPTRHRAPASFDRPPGSEGAPSNPSERFGGGLHALAKGAPEEEGHLGGTETS
eukprot:12386223-Alexandrium_andersonii.AAC.1